MSCFQTQSMSMFSQRKSAPLHPGLCWSAGACERPCCDARCTWRTRTGRAGQLFIMHTIRAYGALLFATVMNTRQFLSILLSCALFGHPLSHGQWREPGLPGHARPPVLCSAGARLCSRGAAQQEALGALGRAACRSLRARQGQGAWC